MTVNSTRDFIPPEPFEGQNYKPRYARPSASLREELITCFTVVCFFVMAWVPVAIVVIIETAGYNIPQEVYTASIYLVFSNSLVNPIIYGVMNPQFKLAFKKALGRGRHGNGNANQNRTENGVRHERPRELGSET